MEARAFTLPFALARVWGRMKGWRRHLHRFCAWLYYSRVRVIHPERLPASGPTLYLGLHRNGAVDGFIYHSVLPAATFLISTQLRQHWVGRCFFQGIEVVRSKDEGDRTLNARSLEQCMGHLGRGGELFIFPEGTSSLGPRHLPFKNGAAQLLLDHSGHGGAPVKVVPLGIHYECAWAFRSRVEVVVGTPIGTELPPTLSPLGQLKELKRRTAQGLEAVGINVESAERQETLECLAHAATLRSPCSYFRTLKALEPGIPAELTAAWHELGARRANFRLWQHQGVPLMLLGPVWAYVPAFCCCSLVVLLAVLLNLPPLAVAAWSGKRFPDGRNVIALWRLLVGAPCCLLWWLLLLVLALVFGQTAWLVVYAGITWAGLRLYDRFKQLAVALHNGWRHPEQRQATRTFHEVLAQTLNHIRHETN